MNARPHVNFVAGLSAIALVACFVAGPVRAAEEITSDNWTEMVSFKPDMSVKIKPGKKITKKNVAEVEALLPPSLKMQIEKYNMTLKLVEYQPIHPSSGYIEATNKYRGQPRIKDVGKDYRKVGITGYVAGLPFPQPKNGLEVAWNYQYAYNGDDGDNYYNVFWISAASGIEHKEEWRWAYIIRTINRTDIEPIPAIEEFKKKGLQYTSITYALAPYDKKGFGALYSRAVEPKDQQGHIYVPAMRRVLRNTFGTRGDTWNSTDYLYEDIRGYMGYPEWMNWKLVAKKTIVLPMRAGSVLDKKHPEKVFDIKKKPHWNPKFKWERRPVYVVEVIPKFPDYPYSRQLFYIDAETFQIPYKEAFDKKGDLWKVTINGWNESPDMDSVPGLMAGSVTIDFQAEHATLIHFFKALVNTDLDHKMFTLSSLRKRGK